MPDNNGKFSFAYLLHFKNWMWEINFIIIGNYLFRGPFLCSLLMSSGCSWPTLHGFLYMVATGQVSCCLWDCRLLERGLPGHLVGLGRAIPVPQSFLTKDFVETSNWLSPSLKLCAVWRERKILWYVKINSKENWPIWQSLYHEN